jgi:phenylalanyl-tRNA synthetase beta chain
MMCSERELGLGDDHAGIMILPADARVGESLEGFLGLTDSVLELGVTANRPDCLSMLGVAREVAAITRKNISAPSSDVRESGPDIASLTSVTIDDPGGCPRYAARIVRNVKPGPSPAWMQRRLLKAGLRPLSNIVDVTNYVLIELGHPLHAFDYDKLDESRIVVRRARKGEKIVTLDGSDCELTEQMLVIADAEKAVAIAGVMGGATSEVTDQTRNVLIESAYFDPVSIRRTSKSLGLSTEASYRFERGADPEMALTALDRAAALMAELAGGKIATGRIDCYPRKVAQAELTLRHERVKRIIGADIPPETSISILESLWMKIVSQEPGLARVLAPSFRPDIKGEIDLIEEIARIYGYESIPPTYPQDSAVMKRGLQPSLPEDGCRGALRGSGFSEVITFSFGSPADMADFINGRDEMIRLRNPLTEDTSALRTTMIPGLLRAVLFNFNAGNKDLKIFEIGKTYWPVVGQTLPDERSFVCVAATGNLRPISWRTPPAAIDFFDLKGVAETLLESQGCASAEWVKAVHRGFHPGLSADIVAGGKRIGRIGEIHPDLLSKYEFSQKVCVFEIDLSSFEKQPGRGEKYEKVSRFPYSDRDMAIVVDEHLEASALRSTIAMAGGNMLRRVNLFDIYRGKQVGEGKKSVAFSLRFQSDERTLTDEEVTAVFDRIIGELEKRFSSKLRT